MRTFKSNHFSFLFPKFSPQAHGAKLQKLTEMELRNWYACNYSIHISIGMPFPNSIAFICTCDFHKQSSQECIKKTQITKAFTLDTFPSSCCKTIHSWECPNFIYPKAAKLQIIIPNIWWDNDGLLFQQFFKLNHPDLLISWSFSKCLGIHCWCI